jgi:hypothetical protein
MRGTRSIRALDRAGAVRHSSEPIGFSTRGVAGAGSEPGLPGLLGR